MLRAADSRLSGTLWVGATFGGGGASFSSDPSSLGWARRPKSDGAASEAKGKGWNLTRQPLRHSASSLYRASVVRWCQTRSVGRLQAAVQGGLWARCPGGGKEGHDSECGLAEVMGITGGERRRKANGGQGHATGKRSSEKSESRRTKVQGQEGRSPGAQQIHRHSIRLFMDAPPPIRCELLSDLWIVWRWVVPRDVAGGGENPFGLTGTAHWNPKPFPRVVASHMISRDT